MNEMQFKNNQENKNTYNYQSNSPIYSTNYSSQSPKLTFINDFLDNTYTQDNKKIDFTDVTGHNEANIIAYNRTNLPHFFKHENRIKVPSKVEYALRRLVPKALMKAIDPNIDVSVEKCLLFTSNFSSTYFVLLNDSKSEGWKELKADYLQDYFSNSSQDYKNIFTALNYTLDTGSIIERDKFYTPGEKCYNYRLGESYIQKGLKNYELKTEVAINLLNKRNACLLYTSPSPRD